MEHKSKIYQAIQYPFEKRKDDLGSKVSCNVRTAEERLRALNLSKEELEVLKEEYERTYEGSKLSLEQIVAFFSAFLAAETAIGGVVFSQDAISEAILSQDAISATVLSNVTKLFVFLVFVIVLVVGFYAIIKKVCSGNDSSRDYLMAIAILLWEKKQNEAALVHGENGTEA